MSAQVFVINAAATETHRFQMTMADGDSYSWCDERVARVTVSDARLGTLTECAECREIEAEEYDAYVREQQAEYDDAWPDAETRHARSL